MRSVQPSWTGASMVEQLSSIAQRRPLRRASIALRVPGGQHFRFTFGGDPGIAPDPVSLLVRQAVEHCHVRPSALAPSLRPDDKSDSGCRANGGSCVRFGQLEGIIVVDLAEGIRKLRTGDWDGAHEIAQSDSTPLGAWLHGILHLMEGDVGNARYWYTRAGRPCPTASAIESELSALERELNTQT